MSKWSEWKSSLGESRPWHALDPNKHVEKQSTADQRFEVCLGCDQLNSVTKQCKICLCYMPIKTTLALSECPIHKWGKEEQTRNEMEK
jgi:hypothetical protein